MRAADRFEREFLIINLWLGVKRVFEMHACIVMQVGNGPFVRFNAAQ